ncbi:hypothetical protein GCM10023085_10800 [Actinomadura viridis]|uniref:IS1096 element passenger TnpR family protein n=1 Tax=Actinomadura viridis TaxID=58110 RepID=UPI0018CAD05C
MGQWRLAVPGTDAARGKFWCHVPDQSPVARGGQGQGACPPEDCGGVWGYERLKDTLSAPDAARYRTTSFNAAAEPVREGRTLTVQGKLSRYVGGWKPWSDGTGRSCRFRTCRPQDVATGRKTA